MNLSPNEKIAGVLAPLFALRIEDDLGIGDVAGLRQFIDWARGIGFKLVQLLPINETGGDNSPYNAISSRAIDPTTLHLAPGAPEDLSEEAFAEVTAGIDLPALRRGQSQIRDRQTAEEKTARARVRRFPGACPNRSADRGSVRRILPGGKIVAGRLHSLSGADGIERRVAKPGTPGGRNIPISTLRAAGSIR